jgi:hypothetical protein
MSNYVNPLAQMALAPMTTQQKGANGNGNGTWFEALAQAWGQALDKQAATIQQQSDAVSGGNDTPGAIVELSAQSLKMGFLSNSSHSSISSVGEALSTMARKQ